MNYTVKIKEIEDGWFMGQCEQIPGALTQGKTIEEVKENIKEAIMLVLKTEKELGIKKHSNKAIIRRELVTV